MTQQFNTRGYLASKTGAQNAVVQASSYFEDDDLNSPIASEDKSREEIRREARAARQWLIDNPAPKNAPPNPFLPLSDEPYLELTDELYFRLVNSGKKFEHLPKSDFDYLRSQNFSYRTADHSFSSTRNRPSQQKTEQHVDFKVFSIGGEALVKTCEKFCHAPEPIIPTDFDIAIDAHIVAFNAYLAAGGKAKDFLEYDEIKRKREQKRIKPTIKGATDFSVLRDMRKMQDGKKSKRIEDFKLFDFNGTDFNQVSQIHPNLKLSDFEYTDFKEVRCIDNSTGELLTFTVTGTGKKRRFILQTRLSKRDDRISMQQVMAKLLSEYRVSKCMRCVQSKTVGVGVFKSKAHGTISLSNLQSCGAVWHCPWCAAKITERRRVEMNQGMVWHKSTGGSNSFVTRTVPHTKYNTLLFLRDGFRKADKYMKSSRKYKKMLLRFLCPDNIKGFEATVGHINGWHLHIHEIFFHNSNAFEGEAVSTNPAYVTFLKEFEEVYYEIWRDAAVKAGFEMPSRQHGLQVQNGDFAADYVAKWGCEPESKWDSAAELTKAHIKKSRHGFTPWELTRLYRDTGDERLVPIIKEFAHTMHGQQQLIWSKGLKDKCGINDISDEELAEQLEDDGEELGVLSPVQWKFIAKNDLRAEFFHFAAEGWDVVTDFLHSFDEYPKIFSLEVIPKNS